MKPVFRFLFLALMAFPICAESQTWQWVRQAGGISWDEAEGIYVSPNGYLYVTGEFMYIAAFATDTVTSVNYTRDIFLAKYDTAGTLLWVRRAGGLEDGMEHGSSIVVDDDENVYVAGYFAQTAQFDSISVTAYSSVADIFLAKYSPNGDVQWVRHFNSGNRTFTSAFQVEIDADGDGNIYMTGLFQGVFPLNWVVFDGDTLTATKNIAIFIAKFDAAGSKQWIRTAQGTSFRFWFEIATDFAGNSFIAGNFSDTLYIENDTLLSRGDDDVFIAGYDSSGSLLLLEHAGGTHDDEAAGIAVDLKGNFFVSGTCIATMYFEGTAIIPDTGEYSFLAKYTYSGDLLWAQRMPGYENYITADGYGNCYMAGSFGGGPIYVDDDTLLAPNNAECFVLMTDANGVLQGALQSLQQIPNSFAHAIITDIAADNNGGCYVTGNLFGDFLFGTLPLYSFDPGSNNVFVNKAQFPIQFPVTVFDTLYMTICAGDSVFFGGYWFNTSGIYDDTLIAASGADSIVLLNLSEVDLQPVITQNDDTLSTGSFAGYVWFNNGRVVGNTQHMEVKQNGDYSVQVVDSNGCAALSSVFTVTGVGVGAIANHVEAALYPNPNKGNFILQFSDNTEREIIITDMLGKAITSSVRVRGKHEFTLNAPMEGIYFLLMRGEGRVMKFVVRQ